MKRERGVRVMTAGRERKAMKRSLLSEMRITEATLRGLGGIKRLQAMTPLGRELLAAMIHAPAVSYARVRERARELGLERAMETKVQCVIRLKVWRQTMLDLPARKVPAVRERMPVKPVRREMMSIDLQRTLRIQRMMRLAEKVKAA